MFQHVVMHRSLKNLLYFHTKIETFKETKGTITVIWVKRVQTEIMNISVKAPKNNATCNQMAVLVIQLKGKLAHNLHGDTFI